MTVLRRAWLILMMVAVALAVATWLGARQVPSLRRSSTWQAMASPGELSNAHAFLSRKCAACHTPVSGVEAKSCIVCHANDQSLLQRQPTAFHAQIQRCSDCHIEHQGKATRITGMDHEALARIGSRNGAPSSQAAFSKLQLAAHAKVTRLETMLDCASCHSNQDVHRSYFGTDCAQCHATAAWTIPEFQHPAPSSTQCAQCHQAPPSHYMEHFKMVSMTIAQQPHAQVNQCYLCHQTNGWNDIKGVGWYKHH